jgi:hypothetical protein
MITVGFDAIGGNATFDRQDLEAEVFWNALISLTRRLNLRNATGENRVTIPWSDFLEIGRDFEDIRVKYHVEVEYAAEALVRLHNWVSEQRFLADSKPLTYPEEAPGQDVIDQLGASSWDVEKRRPTTEQVRDISFLCRSPHGAVFSVPGAGKTSVALAHHEILKLDQDIRLLVVAPKNAFPAWDEALSDCLSDDANETFTRLTGGVVAIAQMLRLEPRYAIITYDQARIAVDFLKIYLTRTSVHLILDESHRIKGGGGKNSQALLELAPFAKKRNILTGTPMPNSISDLVPQFMFLYPASNLGRRILASPSPATIVRRLYTRTRYSELGIPRPLPQYVAVDMSDAQVALYALLRDDFLKQTHLHARDSDQLRASVMRLLRVAIDPPDAARSILANHDFQSPVLQEICNEVCQEELSPRLEAVVDLVRARVERGEKVVVWAPYIGTIDKLVVELSEYGARALYGQTPSGGFDEEDTREYIVRQFHDSDTANVLVANPAAGGEGISLHRVCHFAVYVGRTYNAAHYMQSRDRICRLGMPEGVIPEITIFECRAPQLLGSIDLSVRRRLDAKIEQMGRVLDDPDLLAIALESADFEQDLYDGLNFDDLNDLISELGGRTD